MIPFQDPAPIPQAPTAPSLGDPGPAAEILHELQALGWVDHSALAVLLVFFVLGLFKGLIWQVSRIGILVASYFVAGRFGHEVAAWFGSAAATGATASGAGSGAEVSADTTLYLAYVLLFLCVLVALSLLAMLIKKLADKAGLGFFDRLGGGVLGIATGACVVLALVFVVHMFFPGSKLAEAAESSHSLRFSRRAIDWLGTAVDDDLRVVLSLQPLDASGGTEPPPDARDRSPGQPMPLPPAPSQPSGQGGR